MPFRSQGFTALLILTCWGGLVLERTVLAQDPAAAIGTFYCPMHPDIVAQAEGTCSRCGMKLVPGDPLDAREYLVNLTSAPQAVRPGRPAHLVFTIRDPQTRAAVRNFAIVHDKPFHLFVVSHDLEFYDHLHPEMRPDGTWAIDVTVPKPGYYKLYADFLPIGGTPQVIPRLLVAGNPRDLDEAHAHLPAQDLTPKTAGSMTVSISLPTDGLVAGRDEKLLYRIVDSKTGRPVTDLEAYLAAYGHTLVVSEDTLEYVHAHPVELLPDKIEEAAGGPELTFKALLPKPGRYRLWTQLKRGGTVSTISFTVTAASPSTR